MAKREYRPIQTQVVRITGAPAAQNIDPRPDIGFQTLGKPCAKEVTKGRCNVSLVFGTYGPRGVWSPALRFCEKKGQPGIVVPVASPKHALATSRNVCGCVKKGRSPRACVVSAGAAPLSGVRRRRGLLGLGFLGL